MAETVTSFAEVWIEIASFSISSHAVPSLPSRKCGLKSLMIIAA